MFLYDDLSGIEARTLRWLAGSPSLKMFAEKDRGGADPYCVTAAKAFNLSLDKITEELRQCGKVLCLQAQYQSGPGKVKQTISVWSGGKVNVTLEFAKQAVAAFRKSEPEIVSLWENLNKAFKAVLTGQLESVSICGGKLRFTRPGKSTVAMRLPSGRSVYYNKCRILDKDVVIKGTDNQKVLRKGSIVYYKHDADFTTDQGLTGYYGGLGSENAASGVARDIMAEAMLKCEASGLPITHHAHDSLMVELPASVAKERIALLKQILTTPPAWCSDIPLASDTKITRRMP